MSAGIWRGGFLCFNTQPPEGGWAHHPCEFEPGNSFNTQPPEGGWNDYHRLEKELYVSTHSRPKAAGKERLTMMGFSSVSTHSRPKAAGMLCRWKWLLYRVSTHSRPKAAGARFGTVLSLRRCFNTQPPEGGWMAVCFQFGNEIGFQHTAARRRLDHAYNFNGNHNRFNTQPPEGGWVSEPEVSDRTVEVSTHSRPKAAGDLLGTDNLKGVFQHTAARRRLAPRLPPKIFISSFNTQPPEGGWLEAAGYIKQFHCFNTQPPEGGW